MATLTTVSGVNYAKTIAVPPQALEVNESYGKIRVLYDEYTVDTADEFGTSGLINMMKIPKGAKVLGAHVVCPATGATGIFDVGWDNGESDLETADADGIFAGQDPGAAAVNNATIAAAGFGKTFLDTCQVQVDWSEATADMGTLTIKLAVFIVVE